MSGINSLIDTVLHQVLGKRADTPAPRDLNEPVRPVSPSEAPRALHSDSRLEGRERSPQNAPIAESAKPPREARGASPAARPGGEAPPSSTQTHFTPAARSIADVLLRFPAPPSALRLPVPLMASSESLSPGPVAERLQGSVRDSGLFYESHLSRWYRGELSREQLLREPQNGGRPAALPPVPGPAVARGAPQAAVPGELGTPADSREATQQAAGRELLSTAVRDPVQESLQGIVRQQLEMLVSPVLRWEGDVWTGLFMALVMQLPVAGREGGQEEGEEGEREERGGFRTSMTLQVADFGEVRVAIWLSGLRLDIGLAAPDPAVRETLEAGMPRLESRLEPLGLEAIRVRVLEALSDDGA